MSHHTWLHKVVRSLVRPLASTPVRPNHLTTARLLSGVAAAACYATGEGLYAILGSACFVLSMLLDRADGELARLQGSSSRWGHLYDLITDAICNALVLIGIGFGLREGPLGDWAIAMGVVAGLAVMYVLWLMVQLEEQAGQGSAQFSATAGFDPDDALLAVPFAMVLGLAEPLLVAATIGAPLAGVVITWSFARRRASPRDQTK